MSTELDRYRALLSVSTDDQLSDAVCEDILIRYTSWPDGTDEQIVAALLDWQRTVFRQTCGCYMCRDGQ